MDINKKFEKLLDSLDSKIAALNLRCANQAAKITKLQKQHDFYKNIATQYMQPVPQIEIDELPANLQPNGLFGNDNHIKGGK